MPEIDKIVRKNPKKAVEIRRILRYNKVAFESYSKIKA